ncbi:MAG: TolC family protein [Hyphomicrobiaceae bacterium]|nr:TolC family protein [Hyphomicrobiaceae bacterium]
MTALMSVAGILGPLTTEVWAQGVPVPDELSSDRELPRREWITEIHPVPGRYGRPSYEASLTLREAIGRALDFNPAVKAAFLEIEARHGEEAQAGVKPNPELLMEIENFAGSKDKSSFGAAETTFSLTQTIELGDKRLRRLQAAHLDASLAGWDYETIRVQVATATARAYVDVVTAQERIKVLRDFVAIAEKTQASVDARVKGGKASPIELDRIIVASARAKALSKAEQARLEAAKRRLAVFWGAEKPDFGTAIGRLGGSKNVPALARLKSVIENNPALARWSDEVGRRIAQLDVEVGKSVPDFRVGAGVRHFAENDSVAAVASVSIPLQFFDTNKGNIVAAEQRIAKAEFDRETARAELVGALVEALGELDVAATQLRVFETEVLPPAQSAFDRTKVGYDEGKFDILNVLDAQRSVFEARLEILNARADYEKAKVRIEAIIGRDLGGL